MVWTVAKKLQMLQQGHLTHADADVPQTWPGCDAGAGNPPTWQRPLARGRSGCGKKVAWQTPLLQPASPSVPL
eukprot:362889-Chlamydomonas_euryale.AAC.2